MNSIARALTRLLSVLLVCGSAWSQEKAKAEKPTYGDVRYGPAERNGCFVQLALKELTDTQFVVGFGPIRPRGHHLVKFPCGHFIIA